MVVWSNSCVSYVTIIGTNVTFPPFPIPGYFQTNTTTTTVLTNICQGDYYIVPTPPGSCGAYIASNALSTAIGVTNTVVVYTPTNAIVTNNPTGLVTSNLTLLEAQSLTNSDAALVALYPDLVIVPNSTASYFTNVVTFNVTIYYTNYPTDPPGIPPRGVVVTNYTTNVLDVYTREFANVVVWSNSCVSYETIIVTNVTFPPFPIPGYSPDQHNDDHRADEHL